MSVFSIITICFNSEKTIERTIKSVLSQTYKDYEYIIVDGASKDGTLDIVKKYEPLFEGRMKWKSEPDNGIYNAMNKGIQRATGEIIGIVNSDDWLEPNALEIVNQEYCRNNYNKNAIYCGGIIFHTLDGKIRYLRANKQLYIRQSKYYSLSGIRHPATFVPHKIYAKVGLFDERINIAADSDFLLRCIFNKVDSVVFDAFLSNMSDGGASNRKDIYQILKNDRKIILAKNNVKGLCYVFQMFHWIIRKKIKKILIELALYRKT